RVHGHPVCLVVAATAEVGAKHQAGVDDQRLGGVVGVHLEADGLAVQEQVPAGHRPPHAVDRLVHDRGGLYDGPAGGLQEQGPPDVERRRPQQPLPIEADHRRIDPGGHHEVVLQLAARVAVVDQIYAGVEVVVAQLPIVGYVGVPGGGVLAQEVVAR